MRAVRERARVRVGRLRAVLLVAALWFAGPVLPAVSSGEDGVHTSAFVPLAVQPSPWPVDWSQVLEPDASWLARLAEELARQHEPALEGVTWKSAFEEREAGTHDSRTLIGWRARASSSLWSGVLTGDVNLLAVEPLNSIGFGAEPRRWLRLAAEENWGGFTLGVRVESVSPGLERVTEGRSEAEGGEAWLEGREGPARLRLSGGRFWDNIADYPWQPRTTKTQGGASLDVSLPVGITLRLAYEGGVTEREPEPRPRTAQAAESGKSAFHGVTPSLSYGGPAWTLTVSSTYVPTTDVRHPDRETVTLGHYVSATFHLLPSVTFTPVLSVAENTYESSGIRNQTTSASVWVSWTSVLKDVDLTVSGSYYRSQDTDGVYDATAINAATGLVWRLRRTGLAGTSLAFEVGANHNLDRVTPSARYAEVYGMVTFRIAAF